MALPVPDLRSIELIALNRQRADALAHLVASTLIAGVVNAAVEAGEAGLLAQMMSLLREAGRGRNVATQTGGGDRAMRYIFGDYSLDTQRYELRRAGELIHLGPQVFNVLAYLMVHRDRVVSRDELFARLWPDQFVTDDALGRCIRAARRALEDRPEAPRYIMTTRGRGYRFIAPVQEQPHGSPVDGMVTTVPAQSSPRPSSAAGSEGPPPVSVPMVAGELQRPSEEFRPPALAGEYKQVTVLCGGLADALALARRLGPEAMQRHMQMVFTVVHQVLQHYGGSLIEFSGEGFVALLQEADLDPDEGVPLVLSLLDIPLETERLAQLSPPERKARTFALLRHLVFHEAQRHPCILAVENLHWSDATSEEWLTSLVERLAGAALLVLVTYRPGHQPPWLAQSYATQIALSPLRAGDSRTLVQAVLAARIDRLPPEEKRLLQTA
ncbi:MAG: winged helix-turn-helix domain-containing protein, partial [Nitrospinae bacterium]|nr:winged helix-turn-helix domain-containing protein [Nitrospinota bacterium]